MLATNRIVRMTATRAEHPVSHQLTRSSPRLGRCAGVVVCLALLLNVTTRAERHAVATEHPRLLGTRAELQALARERPDAYQRMARVARDAGSDDWAKWISAALVSAIESDATLARQACERALRLVRGPIRQGHVPFGTDLALCGLIYDLCFAAWRPEERDAFFDYFHRTVDANRDSETHVFHNGWYGYKHWGVGIAGYAACGEDPRAASILATVESDYRERAAPALELAGEGGSWAEGYYLHYWLYEWLFFCEIARRCEGVDYYAMASKFFSQRAVASVLETYPTLSDYGSRRCVPMGDGGGRVFGGDRDKALSARRILVNYYRSQPDHQAVHTFNETTPRCSVGLNAYQDFLWRDPTVAGSPIETLPLSHFSPGAGHVFARSDWTEDATYFFFKCSDRFTAHQHLDAGHFTLFKHQELAGDGGHYDEFGTRHDVNYHLRTIAHSTVLVHDPTEIWPAIRAGKVNGNDGGQHHNWPHHNGAVADPQAWQAQRALYDVADVKAVEDQGVFLYLAADATRAYSSRKLARFTRQIVFLRPNTFVILDRVTSVQPEFRKTWLLQAMKEPVRIGDTWQITNGRGRLFVQTLLPRSVRANAVVGDALYAYAGESYPPSRDTGPAPECRLEISPVEPKREDVFLHVLTAGSSDQAAVPAAQADASGNLTTVRVGEAEVRFGQGLDGSVRIAGQERKFGVSARER